jgi:outer membrane protein assembly factor BamA
MIIMTLIVIAYDRELLRRFYLSKGYADFQVVSTNAELTRDGKEFFVTFKVDEGAIIILALAACRPRLMS